MTEIVVALAAVIVAVAAVGAAVVGAARRADREREAGAGRLRADLDALARIHERNGERIDHIERRVRERIERHANGGRQ